MQTLTIGRVARRAGVGVETVRYYERRGLIEQPPRPGGTGVRAYSDEVVRQIRFIRHAQDLGFTLNEIEELLTLRADPDADCAAVRERATVRLENVEHKIEQLVRIRSALERLIAACPGRGALTSCSILEEIQPTEGE